MRVFARRPSRDPDRLRPGWYERETVAHAYEARRFSGPLGRLRHRKEVREILRALDRLGVRGPILDVPCGTGRILAALVPRHAAAGADASEAMLRIARARQPARIVRARLPRLPFRDGAFEAVLSIRFLMHVRGEERVRVLEELARVSRRYVLGDLRHRRSLRYLSRALRVRVGLRRYGKLRLSAREIRAIFGRAGLRVRAIRYLWSGLSEECLVIAEKDLAAPGGPRGEEPRPRSGASPPPYPGG